MPPYGGNRHYRGARESRPQVSSHAPVWGNQHCALALACVICFKSCPRMGATVSISVSSFRCSVSSHAPVWGQLALQRYLILLGLVSSHAPVWGQPSGRRRDATLVVVSSHAPVWGQLYLGHVADEVDKFQVMPPYGGNPWEIRMDLTGRCFKSCPRMGATPLGCPVVGSTVFQVMPPYGGNEATVDGVPFGDLVSSHAPVWGQRYSVD